jgi:hypothetical protein
METGRDPATGSDEENKPSIRPVTPYWVERRWNAVKGRFADLRSDDIDKRHAGLLLCMERQAGWIAWHHPGWNDAQAREAYMLAGLRLAHALDPLLGDEYAGFAPEVWELHQRVLGTCHPAFNPEAAAAADGAWQTPEDRRFHFEVAGACARRLIDSVRFWSKQGPHAYTAHVTSFLQRLGWNPEDDTLHWVVLSKSLPPGG